MTAALATATADETTEHCDHWASLQREQQEFARTEAAAFERNKIRARWEAEDALAAARRQLESAARSMLSHGYSVEEVAKRSGLNAEQVTPWVDPYLQPAPFNPELNLDNPFD